MGSSSSVSSDFNFGFAFNNSDFSDRILKIEIIPDSPECKSNDTTDGVVEDNVTCNQDSSEVLRAETLHINSAVLAAKSPFFYKMFSNGMRESEQRQVNLQIHESEKASFMDLLNHIYSNSLTATTPRALVDVLMIADKYDVASCVRYCVKLLLNMPMTCELALLSLEYLSSTVSLGEEVQPLIDSANQFLAAHYKDLTKFREEVLKLPLVAIEAIFSSDTLQVSSEDDVYDFLVEWTKMHYKKAEEWRKVFGSRLAPLIRFSYMTVQKIVNVMSSNDYFDPEFAKDVMRKALVLKSESPYSRTYSAECMTSHGRCVERAYQCIPIKVVSFESPHQQCIMYLQLKREECLNLFPSGIQVYSQSFQLGGRAFCLIAECMSSPQTSLPWFGLFLEVKLENEVIDLSSDVELAVREKPTEKYVIKWEGTHHLTGSNKAMKLLRENNVYLFCMLWTEFMGEDSLYFINDTLHIRADITLKQPTAS